VWQARLPLCCSSSSIDKPLCTAYNYAHAKPTRFLDGERNHVDVHAHGITDVRLDGTLVRRTCRNNGLSIVRTAFLFASLISCCRDTIPAIAQ
jgi:hypothetical protein